MNKSLAEKLLKKKQKNNFFVAREKVDILVQDLIEILNPNCYPHHIHCAEDLRLLIERAELNLLEMLLQVLPPDQAHKVAQEAVQGLDKISDYLDKDAEALFSGDPAAKSLEEVIYTYPGFFATAVHRFSHLLHHLSVPILPRLFSEYAHRQTGIDIHPGAHIGEYFFIDHGTGVVIGETTTIGNHVKIYQGVTLGALSVEKSLANTKRHPTIEDNVVIYSNATILGGNTVIGSHSVVGGNVWLTKSIPPHSVVINKSEIEVGTVVVKG